jgi:hypothetical protein
VAAIHGKKAAGAARLTCKKPRCFSAIERSAICSNDPVCADHEPDDRSGDRATHGAACHGCLLIAETSCEMRNLFLDRNLLVPTMAGDGCSFFEFS